MDELIITCDASDKAHAAVAYQVDQQGIGHILCAKARINAASINTTPKAELVAAGLAAKLYDELQKVKPYRSVRFFMDSRIVLGYIQNPGLKLTSFVRNRVRAILATTTMRAWEAIAGSENPADIPTRNKMGDASNWKEMMAPPVHTVASNFVNIPEQRTYSRNFQRLSNSLSKNKRVAALVLNAFRKGTTYSEEDGFKTLIQDDQANLNPQEVDYLDPFQDEQGIWRAGGRLRTSELPYNIKHPIILTEKEGLIQSITQDAHERVAHRGENHTVLEIRQRFWPVKMTSVIRKIITSCPECKRRRYEGTYELQMGQLPARRTDLEVRPFKHVGIDHFGPIRTKAGKKRHVLLITCLQTRAIHLELVHSTSSKHTAMALDMFMARRGRLDTVLSDGATGLLHLAQEVNKKGIQWDNIPANSPHRGGIWESLVRPAKRTLKVLHKAPSGTQELRLALAMVEGILNHRPIAPLPNEPGVRVLTPASFLWLEGEGEGSDPPQLHKGFKHLKKLITKEWINSYLSMLQKVKKWKRKGKTPKVGDMVVVIDESRSRSDYVLGRIQDMVTSEDHEPRNLQIRTPNSLIWRDPRKVIPIE